MSVPEDPRWLSWVAPLVLATTALVAFIRWLFVATIKSEVEKMHAQNQHRFSRIERSLARIEGRLDIAPTEGESS